MSRSVDSSRIDSATVRTRVLALIPAAIAINLVLGTVVATLKIPLYCDAVGTIIATLVVGLRAGIIVGVASFLIGGALVNPVLPWFSATQACIAIYVYLVGRRGWFAVYTRGSRAIPSRIAMNIRPILAGIGLGVVAGIASAPVIVAMFGGVTGSGPSLVVAFLLKSGQTLFRSVLWSGLASEPLDKTVQVIIALLLIRTLPDALKMSFGGGLLEENQLLAQPRSLET